MGFGLEWVGSSALGLCYVLLNDYFALSTRLQTRNMHTAGFIKPSMCSWPTFHHLWVFNWFSSLGKVHGERTAMHTKHPNTAQQQAFNPSRYQPAQVRWLQCITWEHTYVMTYKATFKDCASKVQHAKQLADVSPITLQLAGVSTLDAQP